MRVGDGDWFNRRIETRELINDFKVRRVSRLIKRRMVEQAKTDWKSGKFAPVPEKTGYIFAAD